MPQLRVNTAVYMIIFYDTTAHIQGFIRYLNHFDQVVAVKNRAT
jgi:hypothetical protein